MMPNSPRSRRGAPATKNLGVKQCSPRLISEANPIADIFELKLRLLRNEEDLGHTEVRAELRAKPDEFEGEDFRCTVAFRRAYLVFKLEGAKIVHGTRYGEPAKENNIAEKVTRTIEHQNGKKKEASVKVTGEFGVKKYGAQGSGVLLGNGGIQSSSHQQETMKVAHDENRSVLRVKARGNNTWEAAEPDGSLLDGTYLNDDGLFLMEPTEGSNRTAVHAVALVKHRDVVFDFSLADTKRRFTHTDARLLSILIAKCIAGPQYTGRITVSEAEFEFA